MHQDEYSLNEAEVRNEIRNKEDGRPIHTRFDDEDEAKMLESNEAPDKAPLDNVHNQENGRIRGKCK